MSSPRVESFNQEWALRFLGWAALVLLIALVFARSFGSDLVFDSSVIVGDDPRLREVSAKEIGRVFTENYWWPTMRSNLYRPVTTLSFMFEYSVLGFKERAAGYQLDNLLLHVGGVMLVFSLLRKMGATWAAAWFVSAWFAIHPFSTEIVPNVVGRSDLFAILAIMTGLHVYLDVLSGVQKPGRGLLLIAGIGLLGALAKESVVSLLGLLVWHGLTLGREPLCRLWRERTIGRRELLGAAAVFALILGAVVVPKFIFKEPVFDGASLAGDNPLRGVSWADARLNAMAIMGRNMLGCIVPLEVSGDYSYNQIPLAKWTLARAYDWQVVAWAAGAAGFGALGLFLVRRWASLAFAIGAVFIILLPTANLLTLIGTIRADRLVYPAVVPMVVCAGLLVGRLITFLASQPGSSIKRLRPLGGLGLGGALFVLGAFTHLRGAEWRTTRAFWKSLYAVAPDSYKTKNGWAMNLARDGNLDAANEAVRLSTAALDQIESAKDVKITKSSPLREMNASVYIRRACLFLDANRMAEALADFAHAESLLKPLIEELGAINESLEREVASGLRPARDSTVQMDSLLVKLAEIQRLRGDKTAARDVLLKYLRFNRLIPGYLQGLGRALVDAGEWEAGLGYLLEAAILAPTDSLYSSEAAWVWEAHTLPPSARPMMTDQMRKGVPPLPPINLGDEGVALQARQAVVRLADAFTSLGLSEDRCRFIRQVRFRIAKPSWTFGD